MLDLLNVTLCELGQPRPSEAGNRVPRRLLASFKANKPAVAEGYAPFPRGRWRHAVATVPINVRPDRKGLKPGSVVRLMAMKRRKLIELILPAIEQEMVRRMKRRQSFSPRQWRLVVLKGEWMRVRAVRLLGSATYTVFLDCTFVFERKAGKLARA